MAGPGSENSGRIAISHVVTDPIWSLCPWPLDVTVGESQITIPALSAAKWLVVLMAEELDPWDVVPGLCIDAEEVVTEALLNEQLEYSELRDIVLDVISMVTGRPWWIALRLVHIAKASWEAVGGELAFRGVQAQNISLAAWLDATLLVCLRSMESKDVTMFMTRLEAPPPGVETEEPEMDRASFMAMG